MRPKAFSVCVTASSTWRSSPTSHATATPWRPSAHTASATGSREARRRPHATTCAPTFASSTAIARPMPWPAPVTMATRSRSVSGEKPTTPQPADRSRSQNVQGVSRPATGAQGAESSSSGAKRQENERLRAALNGQRGGEAEQPPERHERDRQHEAEEHEAPHRGQEAPQKRDGSRGALLGVGEAEQDRRR